VWRFVDDTLNQKRIARGNLFQLSSVLYRQAEVSRYGGTRRTVPTEIWQEASGGYGSQLIVDGRLRNLAMKRILREFRIDLQYNNPRLSLISDPPSALTICFLQNH
jgi:hypothetical protein